MDIILSTLNARYSHSSFGLRYLRANLGNLKDSSEIIEFTIQTLPRIVAEEILKKLPKIIGFGVYIWNIAQTTEVVALLKKIAPEIVIVIGGPEVSYEYEEQTIFKLADYLITGEADLTFPNLCQKILSGSKPDQKVIKAPLPKTAELTYPYEEYNEKDLKQRVLYVEASRGCPFTCEFCLSSLDIPLRQFELSTFLEELEKLYLRGARTFKFVDRTFNLKLSNTKAILEFFIKRYEQGMFIHFEMVPDRMPPELVSLLANFPDGAVQLEVGIQTFNPEVSALISRKQDYAKIEENLKTLKSQTGVHVHVDLIAGLPGEDLVSFGAGFDRLIKLKPQEIQVGILKRLRGTPIIRHIDEFDMRYSSHPPYEILSNNKINFFDMQRISRFSRYWDMYSNSGRFLSSLPLIWNSSSPFWEFMRLSDWIYQQTQQQHAISLKNLANLLYQYFAEVLKLDKIIFEESLANDYLRTGAVDLPDFMKGTATNNIKVRENKNLPIRQQRHLN
jgi:radical SAM superfamily enzyme YgiQ (UPF0313 family)